MESAAERPSQIVHERTVASTPQGQNVVVAMERISTGGTHHEARYQRPASGSMSGSQRMSKIRARTSLFPERESAAREANRSRMAAVRMADREQQLAVQAQQSLSSAVGVARISWQHWKTEQEGTWDDPAVRAREHVLAESLGIGNEQLLLGSDWVQTNMPTLADFVTFCHKELDWTMPLVHSPVQYKPGIMTRCLSVYDYFDAPLPLVEFVEYSLPASHVDSQWKMLHCEKEASALRALAAKLLERLEEIPSESEDDSGDELEQQQEREQREQREQREREQCEREEQEHTEVSGSRAVLLDFYGGGSPQAHQAAQIMRDAGVSCRTLFASCQQTDSCGYNGSKWACMLWALGPERFYEFTREQASVVLQPAFIAEQNVKLGYGHSTEARWLGCRRILELATLDNPDGAGVDPWWLSCPAYDHFLEAFQSTISDADHFRRGGLEIMVVNTDCAGASGKHWFVVAWVIE
jgi:hypothetical protein